MTLRDIFALFSAGPGWSVVLVLADGSEVVKAEGLEPDAAMALGEQLVPSLRPGERISLREAFQLE